MNEEKLELLLNRLDDLQSGCTQCGLCLENCATFQVSGWEQESPRGRIRLAKDLMAGKIEPHSSALETFNRCLGCHSCEAACPADVRYSEIRHLVQQIRTELPTTTQVSPLSQKSYRKWIKMAYRLGSRLFRFYAPSWIHSFFPGPLGESYLKRHGKKGKHGLKGRKGESEADLTLVIGCVQDLHLSSLIEESVNCLNRLGYQVHLSRDQPCCGALFNRLIAGGQESVCYSQEREKAADYQTKRINEFWNWTSGPFCFLSMNCQSHLTSHLVHALAQENQNWKDLYELIREAVIAKNVKLVLDPPLVAYYQPYCHRPKNKPDPVWQLLNEIEGLTLHYLKSPYACCGGYNGECVFHPESATQVLMNKVDDLPPGSTLVITSFDCQAQFLLNRSRENPFHLVYPIQLINKSLFNRK